MSAAPPGYAMTARDDDFVPKTAAAATAAVPARVRSEEENKEGLRARAWQVGKSPFSNVFSSLLMMYFSGSHLSLMSLMLCLMMLMGPVKSFLSFRSTFAPFDQALRSDAVLLRSKAVFLLINGAVFSIALWKIWQLGVLPITPADLMRYAPPLTSSAEILFVKL